MEDQEFYDNGRPKNPKDGDRWYDPQYKAWFYYTHNCWLHESYEFVPVQDREATYRAIEKKP